VRALDRATSTTVDGRWVIESEPIERRIVIVRHHRHHPVTMTRFYRSMNHTE